MARPRSQAGRAPGRHAALRADPRARSPARSAPLAAPTARRTPRAAERRRPGGGRESRLPGEDHRPGSGQGLRPGSSTPGTTGRLSRSRRPPSRASRRRSNRNQRCDQPVPSGVCTVRHDPVAGSIPGTTFGPRPRLHHAARAGRSSESPTSAGMGESSYFPEKAANSTANCSPIANSEWARSVLSSRLASISKPR